MRAFASIDLAVKDEPDVPDTTTLLRFLISRFYRLDRTSNNPLRRQFMELSAVNFAYRSLFALLAAASIAASSPSLAQSTAPATSRAVDVAIVKESAEFAVPFDQFTQKLEKMLGRYDYDDIVLAAKDYQKGLARVKASQGAQGLMLFRSDNHGELWALIGEPPKKAMRYYVGNPLIAIQMTRKNIGAAAYAPLTLVVYQTDDGKTAVVYDRPSSLFGQFHDPDIDRVGAALDTKLKAVLAAAGEPN